MRVSKDILRASQLALLDKKNKHVASDLLKVSSGQPSMSSPPSERADVVIADPDPGEVVIGPSS